MLILCVGMYRACSTWQYGVVGELIERHRGGQRLGFVGGDRFVSDVEASLDESRWSVLKSHGGHERYAARLSRGQALGIYSHRDLRDVAYSMMHKLGVDFQGLIKRDFIDQCLRNDRFWRDRPGMLFQSYEDLIAEPARGVSEIARHLGIAIEAGEDQEIADLLSLEKNRERTREIAERLQSEGVALDPRDQDKADPRTLLHWNHVRDGRAGSWRDSATAEQKAYLTRVCGPWLLEHGYPIDADQLDEVKPEPGFTPEEGPQISYARNGEDIILGRMFRGRKGTYVDVGANHPTVNNATYSLFVSGWRGVNIEPAGSAFELFARRRPGDLNLQVAISDVEGDRTFDKVVDRDGLSSDLTEVDRAAGVQGSEQVVSTRTFASLIDQHGLVPPDVFSVDIGGGEEQVIRGIPLAVWQPKVFVIRGIRSMTNDPCHEAWEPLLLQHGYLFAASNGTNRFYLRGDLVDSLHLLRHPIDELDGWVKAETSDQRERADLLQGLLDDEHRNRDETLVRLAEERAQLATLKARYSSELEDRHRHYLAWLDEREGWRVEREASRLEIETTRIEHEATRADRDATRSQLEAAQGELVATRADREAIRADRDLAWAEVDELSRRILELERLRDDFAREVNSLHSVIGRLQGEIHARDVELDRTRTRLGPYLKIDRLGVVTAIQRKVHAHRAHSKA